VSGVCGSSQSSRSGILLCDECMLCNNIKYSIFGVAFIASTP